MTFIHPSQIPPHQKVTYASFVCDHRSLKLEQWRVRLIIGSNKLSYSHDMGSPAANLIETKILLNSVISESDKGARFMTLDLKDHFLASPMQDAEYMKIPQCYIPPDIMQKYNLSTKLYNGYVYCKIKKGIYGLKQTDPLAYNFLVKNLKLYGYYPIPHTEGIWKHT